MIKAAINKKQTIYKIIKIFLAQYLTTVQQFSAFQTDSINLLATYIIKFIQNLSIRIKMITHMQGKTQSNIFHMIWCLQQNQKAPMEKLIGFMKQRIQQPPSFHYNFFQKLKQQIFEDDIQNINNLQREDRFTNIRYLKKTYSIKPINQCLPFKASIDQLYVYPPEYTFKETKKTLQMQERNYESMRAATLRETKRGIAQLNKKKNRQQQQQRKQINMIDVLGKKVKKISILNQI